ncbi:MAG TPA: hypothetical protein PK874_11500 [Desulfobacteraceae bacterium]|nr:hypothetical protein [Desulfobacteraceae bacterium]HPJ66192.1 hypothetical protein [Desulfobacteraceae bacterium]HPQ27088.1 hypothetical protein [Desulfobacteraceae bacterium]
MNKGYLSAEFFLRICFLIYLFSVTLFFFFSAADSIEASDIPYFQEADIKKDIIRGIDLLYNEQFDEAENIFQKVITASSERPSGYFYLAMVSWSQLSSGFWSPSVVEQFRKRIDKTISVAENCIQNNGNNSYDYFFLGGALGFKGRFRLMQGKWFSSFLLATDAVEALKTCINMDPYNRDVLLGLGTYDYYTARLSGVLKFLSYLLIRWGDKEEGLRKLHLAAKEAVYSSTEAKSMLLHIYLFLEEDFSKALNLAEELSKEYKKNNRFELLKGVCYIRLGMDLKYKDLAADLRKRSSDIPNFWEKRALYLESIKDIYNGAYPEARSKISEILKAPDPVNDPVMIAWPLLKMGMIFDLIGKREEARKYYLKVLNMENGSGAQFLAEKLLKEPPGKKDPFIGY